jgi:hypothetical protein
MSHGLVWLKIQRFEFIEVKINEGLNGTDILRNASKKLGRDL